MSANTSNLIDQAARLMKSGHFSDACEQCDRILQTDARHARALYLAGTCALQLEDYARSAGYLERAAAETPDAAEVVNNLGVAYLHGGRAADAVEHLSRAVELKPGYVNAHVNLASALKVTRNFAAAEHHLGEAQALAGNSPEIISDLADVYFQSQRWADAADAYEALVEFAPGELGHWKRLAVSQAKAGRQAQARATVDALPMQGPERADALAEIADNLLKVQQEQLAIEQFRATVELDPDNIVAQAGLAQIYQRRVPRWHFTMLNDHARNAAYSEVIAQIVRPGDIVLDIGSGSGLLAMMAARAGAAHVYTCEGERLIAAKAREIVAANGFEDRITVFERWSSDLVLGRDIPVKADVLVSEIVDNVLIGEGIIPTLEHALRDLVKPEARIVPQSGEIYLMAIESETLYGREKVSTADGFDVSAFNEFSSHGRRSSLTVRPDSFTALSASATAFAFDFTQGEFPDRSGQISIECTRDGTLHGVLAWFSMTVLGDFAIDNDPAREDNHWGHEAFFLRQPRQVRAGEHIALTAAHDKTSLNVVIE